MASSFGSHRFRSLVIFITMFSEWSSMSVTHAILTKQIQFPGTSYNSGQVVGILTGPHPSWSEQASSGTGLSFNYINADCQVDGDCYPGRTLLYCIASKCNCISQGATYLNGYFYNYNMEWNDTISQCVSQSGSPCTLKEYWYSSETLRMGCKYDHDCVEVTSSPAKVTLASQKALGFGSTVSMRQQQGQVYSQQQSHFTPYFGSGVAGYNGDGVNIPGQAQGSSSSLSATATASTSPTEKNFWGICVRRSLIGASLSAQFGSGSSSISNQFCSYLCLFYVALVLLLSRTRTTMY